MSDISERGYAHPERMVSTEWVAEHRGEVILVESNEDPLLYSSGHIEGAHEVDWTRDLNDPIKRDYIGRAAFEELMSRIGATPDSRIVFYGDKNNWWACYALWVFGLFGHANTAIMDGGRQKWMDEGRALTKVAPTTEPTSYKAQERDDGTERAFLPEVAEHIVSRGKTVDVRSPEEFSGERMHMPDYPNEGALRGGHIPGAASVPWGRAVNQETHEFKSASELREIYEGEAGLSPGEDAIVYCRIGERSSHTWFALKFLLGYESVRNYDGSWTEWGNTVGTPIER